MNVHRLPHNGQPRCLTPGCPHDPGFMPHCPACQWTALLTDRMLRARDQVWRNEQATARRVARWKRQQYRRVWEAALTALALLVLTAYFVAGL